MNALNSLARMLCIALFCGSVAAQEPARPASGGAKVSGSLQLGRVAFALPPGDWQVVPLEDMAITKADYSCRCEISGAFVHWPLQQAFAIQLDPTGKQLKAAIYFKASQKSIPTLKVWFTTACEARAPALHRDGVDGNFNYPACLSIEAVESPSTGQQAELEAALWTWMKANGVESPHVLLAAKYFKYGTGELVWVLQYVNPDLHGIKPATQRSPGEWTPDAVKADPQKSDYLARLKSWSLGMAEESRRSLRERKPKEASLPAIPSM
jgi:hypothetical protein